MKKYLVTVKVTETRLIEIELREPVRMLAQFENIALSRILDMQEFFDRPIKTEVVDFQESED